MTPRVTIISGRFVTTQRPAGPCRTLQAKEQKAYLNALAAFRNYGRFLDPPVELLRIPFEGKQISGYLRLPKDVRPAPVTCS